MGTRWREVRTCSLIALVLIALCVSSAPASAVGRPMGRALQFGVGGSFKLESFNGTTFAYRRSMSPNVDLRLGASVDLEYQSGDETATGTGTNSGEDSAPLEEWNNNVRLRCEWIAHRGSEVSFYAGGGPQLSFAHSQYVSTDFYFSDDGEDAVRHYKTRNAEYGIGVGGVIGVQWAPVEWCALHVEYRAAAGYTRGEYRHYSDRDGGSNEYTRVESEIADSFEFDSQGVEAGLSIYF